MIDIGETVVNNAFGADPELDGSGQIEAAEQSLFQLATDGGGNDGGFVTFETALGEAIKGAERAFRQAGHVTGLSTGLRDMDGKLGGLHPSDLLILAGRPGMGKTALATKIAFGAAKSLLAEARALGPDVQPKKQVAIFSLEMSAEQLATRLLSEEARISGDRIPPRRHRPEGFRQIRRGLARDRLVAVADRRHARDHHVDAAHALPADAAHQGLGAGDRRLPATDAPLGRHAARQPGAGDHPDHPGPEGAGQGNWQSL